MALSVPHDDRQILDQLVGSALIDEDFCHRLLGKDTRCDIIKQTNLSSEICDYLLGLDDMARLGDFARCLFAMIEKPTLLH